MSKTINQDDNIGKNIKEARKIAGLTQETLVAKMQLSGCDISRGTLAKIEVGIRNIKISEIRAIKTILKTSYDFLFKEAD
ncbi:MAG: helix-turn-helix domain-containing protein [Oscillospiraceae bacterium]|nr:helix-turn-helix domain-containing protein [Oscillospiraceae bacterium]